MTSSVLSVDDVSVAYERMNDCPAHWSVLMRTPVMEMRVEVPLNDFLSTATVVTVPGLRYTLPWRLTPNVEPALVNGTAIEGVKLAPGLTSVSSEMMPQPICSPASIEPPANLVFPLPVIFPVNVPATRYSRDEIAVVNGATGSWVSSAPTTSRCQPSGVSRTPGGPEGTRPSGGSGLVGSIGATAGSAGGGGSATARGAAATGIATHAVASMAKRLNMAAIALSSSGHAGVSGVRQFFRINHRKERFAVSEIDHAKSAARVGETCTTNWRFRWNRQL